MLADLNYWVQDIEAAAAQRLLPGVVSHVSDISARSLCVGPFEGSSRQRCLKETHDVGIESIMKARAVEARQTATDFRPRLRKTHRAWWQEVVMVRVVDRVVLRYT